MLQASLAVQVLVTEYEPAQVPGVVTSLKVTIGLGSILSVAVALVNTGIAGQLIVVTSGNWLITGGVPSPLIIVPVVVDEQLLASVTT